LILVRTLGLFLAWAACGAAGGQESEFPYSTVVVSDDVYVRSGPGKNYYPTTQLGKGDRVEVYRHDPGGWYAIRPPGESFSWISGEWIELDEEGLGVVKGDRVAVRVGSEFSEIRDTVQVRLDRGEVVGIVEVVRFNEGPAAQTWYKIEPPAGEFRWIQGQFLEPPSGVRASGLETEVEPRQSDRGRPAGEVQRTADGSEAAEPDPFETRETDDRRARENGSDENDPSPPARVRLPGEAPLTAREEYVDLEASLSKMVAEEPTAWEFTPLRARAERLLDLAETAADRGRARAILGRIDRFMDVRQRYMRLAELADVADRTDEELTRSRRISSQRASAPRYDGVGRLTPIPSRVVGSSQYVLMDDEGRATVLIAAAPGVNLRHYLGKKIGVYGTTGYEPQLDRRQVTVKHVTVLDETRLR
jgi:hypothetical protein